MTDRRQDAATKPCIDISGRVADCASSSDASDHTDSLTYVLMQSYLNPIIELNGDITIWGWEITSALGDHHE